MIVWLAAALAGLLAQSAPGAPRPDYSASGSEPFWGLEIAAGRMTFQPNDGEPDLRAALPRRRPAPGGYRLLAPRFTVHVRPVICEDEGERRYRDTVRVIAHGRVYLGCGGALLPPATLANTDWLIEVIDGAPVRGDDYRLSFSQDGRQHSISGQAGCNRLTGAYRQRGDRFVAGPVAATRMMCPPPRMAHERTVLLLLAGPLRISYLGGDVLVLTGQGGMIRLRRV